jgi:hypothetical protein
VVGLAVRATLLRPGRAEVRDASAFPGWEAHGLPDELRVVALPGVVAPLALVRWPQWPGDEACVVDVEAGGWREATALLAAVVARAREAGAGRVTVAVEDPPVARAAALLRLPR